MPENSEVLKLIAEYRAAVRSAHFWEDHGSYGDGKADESRLAELAARRKLINTIKKEGK